MNTLRDVGRVALQAARYAVPALFVALSAVAAIGLALICLGAGLEDINP